MAKITLERASEMVSALRELCPPTDTKATDLFDYFVDTLALDGQAALEQFAVLCGFQVVTSVAPLFVPWEEVWKELEFPDNERNDT